MVVLIPGLPNPLILLFFVLVQRHFSWQDAVAQSVERRHRFPFFRSRTCRRLCVSPIGGANSVGYSLLCFFPVATGCSVTFIRIWTAPGRMARFLMNAMLACSEPKIYCA